MKTKLPENETILYGLAVAQMLGITWAFVTYEQSTNVVLITFTVIRGLVFGACLSFGMAISAQKAPRVKAKWARVTAYVFAGLLLIVMPIIMAPAIYMTLPQNIPSGWEWWLSVAISSAPDLVAVLIASQSGALQTAPATQSEHAVALIRTARKPAKKSVAKVTCTEPGCGIPYAWPNGKGAHYKAHHQPVRVDETLLMKGK